MIDDLRYAVRSLLKAPVVSTVAILTLALGIGANTSIFTVVDAVLIKSLPFRHSEQLVQIFNTGPELDRAPISAANFLDLRQQNHSLERLVAYTNDVFTLLGGEAPERLRGERVSWDFFDLLGVAPALGRSFTAAEDEYGRDPVVVLSHEVWKTHFGSRADLIGQTLILNDKPYTVVGVMPPGFTFPDRRIQLWTPICFTPTQKAVRDTNYLSVIGRVKNGLSIQAASAEMNTLMKLIARQYPEANGGDSLKIVSLRDVEIGDAGPLLVILLVAVGCVLLICCANVANLLLGQAVTRQREIAIRTAIGASRARVIRLLLLQSIVLGVIGGACGCVLASWGIDLLVALRPANLPRLDEVTLSWRVLAFAGGVSLASGILFGMAPALQLSGSQLTDVLRQADRTGTTTPSRSRLRSLLVASEVALSVVLLIGASLLIRSFARLIDVDPGFRPENALVVSVPLSASRYPDPPQQSGFFQRLVGQVGQLAGVKTAGVVTDLPLFGGSSTGFDVSSRRLATPSERPLTEFRAASPEYFRAMGIDVISGRSFTDQDGPGAAPVAIINQTLARRYFGNENPIGKRIGLSRPIDWREIVGVVADVKNYGLAADVKPECYVPYLQNTPEYLAGSAGWMMLVVRTNSAPSGFINSIKREIQLIDKDQPISSIKPMTAYVAESVAERRFSMVLLGAFASLALILAAIGIYGVVSYSVTQRTREFGIRIALGARQIDVLGLMTRQGMGPTILGLVIGVIAAAATTRFMASLVFQVSLTDPIVFAVVAVILAGVALAACLIPAYRASRTDPAVALRYE